MSELIMPPEIASAIVAVNKNIKTLLKDHTNKHGGYKFASYDTFLAETGPLLADNGLIIVMDERENHSDGKWLAITFNVYLYHSSGKSYGPVTRSQAVLANGPQAYAACQSYVEKYFMRQLFKIPTGEGEIDADVQSNKVPLPETKRVSKEPVLMDVVTSQRMRDDFIEEIVACKSEPALLEWAKQSSDARKKMLQTDRVVLNETYTAQMTSIKGAE